MTDLINCTLLNNFTLCTDMTNSNTETTTSLPVIWTPDVIQRVVSLVLIMVLTLVGNTAILIALTCSKYRKRNNRVNIFIINLAIGDLTVCFATMTTEILFVAFGEWVLGAAGCKLLTYAQVVTLSSTTFILTAMGFDRYMAICRPLRFTSSHTRARRTIMASWVLAFLFAVPQLFIFVQTVDGYHPDNTVKYGCRSQGYTAQWQRKMYFTFMSIYILVIPAIMISYCYINVARVVWKQGKAESNISDSDNSLRKFIVNKGIISLAKMKTVKMTFCIIITFIACWTPYFVTTLCVIYSNDSLKVPNYVMALAETMALLQSALNPILYGLFNIKIFRGLAEVFCPNRVYKKRVNSFANYNAVNGFYCFTASEERRLAALQASKTNQMKIRCQDRATRSGTSSSDNSTEKPQGSARSHGSCIIAESNKNGFKLRVRFITKEMVHVHDRHGRCLYPKLNTEDVAKIECTL